MRIALLLIIAFVLVSCGSVRVNPKGCKTKAKWGSNPLASREITDEEVTDAQEEIISTKELMVFSDEDIRLRDLFESAGIKCEQVKKIRVQIDTYMFFKRVIQVKIVKF